LKEQGLSLAASDGLINLARQGNQVSFVSLGAKQAKVMGEKGIQGTPTNATLDEIQQISGVLKDSFSKAVQPYIEQHATQMSEGLSIPIEDAYRYLATPIPEERKPNAKNKEPIAIPKLGASTGSGLPKIGEDFQGMGKVKSIRKVR
jgi:hypothetical protein